MSELIVTVLVAVLASSGMWTFLTTIVTNRRKKKPSALERAVLGLMHDHIIEVCRGYIKRNYITVEEKADLYKYCYEPYKALLGDGEVEKYMELLEKLEVKVEVENYED
jgi:hypothetical protein